MAEEVLDLTKLELRFEEIGVTILRDRSYRFQGTVSERGVAVFFSDRRN